MAVKKARARKSPAAIAAQEIDDLVFDIVGQVADRRLMYVLEALTEHETMRFTRLSEEIGAAVSQKMLTQTLRQMERDGLITRTVHPVIPPHVDYRLTVLGRSLGGAFCEVWKWVEANHGRVVASRNSFDGRRGV